MILSVLLLEMTLLLGRYQQAQDIMDGKLSPKEQARFKVCLQLVVCAF